MTIRSPKRRRGTTLVEFAVVCPLTLFLLFGIMIGSIGVFRYQQVAALAREASRWASVHGKDYERETGNPAATAEDIYEKVILPRATSMDPSQLNYQVKWDRSNIPVSIHPESALVRGNTVTVTVTYRWIPQVYLAGPIDLTSTSSSLMMY
jgi:Flp pilus assembly protein TadG